MLIRELFESDDERDNEPHEMSDKLRRAALDFLTPMMGQNVPFITMKQMVAALNRSRFGIVITPSLVMDLLSPDEVPAVSKIEGDRIYLTSPLDKEREVADDQAAKDAEHTQDMAIDHAAKQAAPDADPVTDDAIEQINKNLKQ